MPSALLPRRSVCAIGALAAAVCGLVAAPAARSGDDALDGTLDRATARVHEFFARAQSLVCTETVHVQPLTYSLSSEGFGRTVESELRLSWNPGADGEPATEAQALRQVMRVNGHPPRKNDRRNCTTPERHETETQVLSMLLDGKRDEYGWALAGTGRIDKRPAVLLDYREKKRISLEVRVDEGDEDCLTFDIRGGDRGRVWLDAETYDVLRIDQHLTGQVEAPTPRLLQRRPGALLHTVVERLDRTFRFKRVTFTDPDESMVLPVSATQVMVTQGNTAARQRTTTEYRNYRRFLTGGRIVPEPGLP